MKSKKTGYTDKSIFLPSSGHRFNTYIYEAGSYGDYWSSSLGKYGAFFIEFNNNSINRSNSFFHCKGHSIRPVYGEYIPIQSISVDKLSLELEQNDTYQLTADLYPANAIAKDIRWVSSDESVARVNETGLVSAVGIGSAIITACGSSGVKASCVVTVIPYQEPIIVIDGNLSDWERIEGASSGSFGSFKVYSDDKNLYFYCYRTTEGRFSSIWGGNGYIYLGFELDNNPSNNTAQLWANDAYDLLLLVYPYGGSADSPEITEAAGTAGSCEPVPYTVANVVCKGIVDQSGAKIEFSIPRADISSIPTSPITITAWGNKDLDKVELNCTL